MPGELAGQNRGFPSSPWSIFTRNFPWAFKIPVWWARSPVQHKLTMVVPACNPGTPKVVAGRSEVQGHPWPLEFETSLIYLRPCFKTTKRNHSTTGYLCYGTRTLSQASLLLSTFTYDSLEFQPESRGQLQTAAFLTVCLKDQRLPFPQLWGNPYLCIHIVVQ